MLSSVQRYVAIVRGRDRLHYTYVHTVYEDNHSHFMSQVRMQYSLTMSNQLQQAMRH